MSAAETRHSGRGLAEGEPDPVAASTAHGRQVYIAPCAERDPGPGAELVLRNEHRPPVTVTFGRHLRGRAFQEPERIPAGRRLGDPGDDPEVVLPQPVAQDGLGGTQVDLLALQQGPDPG